METNGTVDLTPRHNSPRYPAYQGLLAGIVLTVAIAEIFGAFYFDHYFTQREEKLDQMEQEIYAIKLEAELRLQALKYSKTDEAVDEKPEEYKVETTPPAEPAQTGGQTVNLFPKPSMAEQLFYDYLDRYAGVDLSKPKPCEPELAQLYHGAEVQLDALYAAAAEEAGSTRYILFVERRRAEMAMRPYPEEDCTPPEPSQPATSLGSGTSDIETEIELEGEYDEDIDEFEGTEEEE